VNPSCKMESEAEIKAKYKELKQKLKNGDIADEEYEREKYALKTAAAKINMQMDASTDPNVKKIIQAVKIGKEKLFKEMVAQNPAIVGLAVDEKGNTLLHWAALNGHKRIAKELLRQSHHFDAMALNSRGQSAVDLARDFNYEELAGYLKEKLPGISETFSDRPSTSMHISQTEDQLDSVSEQLANVQAEREKLELEMQERLKEIMGDVDKEKASRQRAQQDKAAMDLKQQELEAKMAAMEATQQRDLQEKARLEVEAERLATEKAAKEAELQKEKERVEQELRKRMEEAKNESQKSEEEKAAIQAELARLAAEREAKEKELQAEKERVEVEYKQRVGEKEQKMKESEEELAKEREAKNAMLAEMAQLKAQLAQAKKEAEDKDKKAAAPAPEPEPAVEETPEAVEEKRQNEKDRLLEEFEERRRDLEALQKQEQERQERLLQELLEMKRKKRGNRKPMPSPEPGSRRTSEADGEPPSPHAI